MAFSEDAAFKSPQNIRASINLGSAYLQAGRVEDAFNSYSYAIRIASQQQTAVNEKSGIMSLKDKMPAKAYLNRGNIYKENGMHEEALADYSMAIKIYPRMKGPHFNRGYIYLQRGDNALAISDYTDAIKIDPDNAITYYNRAFALRAIGNFQGALDDLDSAIQLNPGLMEAHAQRKMLRQKISGSN